MRVLHTGALEQLVRKHRRVLDKEQRREGRRIDSDKDEKHGKRVARAERERGRAGREEREGRGRRNHRLGAIRIVVGTSL